MAYVSYNKLWESKFDNILSEREKVQDIKINQLKLEVHDTYKKREKYQQTLNMLTPVMF